MRNNKKVGISLSGGGYRAAAFHLGTLNKLHQMDVLQHVDVISTISGGSIIGGMYCTHNDDFESFREDMIEKLTTVDIIKYIFRSWIFIRMLLFVLIFLSAAVAMLFTPHHYVGFFFIGTMLYLLTRYQFLIFPVSKVIESAYDKYFFKGKKLSELNDTPTIVIGSTNLQTSSPFSFTKDRMWDSKYLYNDPPIKFEHAHFPLSKAVMASSSVPAAFSPILIAHDHYSNKDDSKRVRPVLVDGGVYDNQGIHYLTRMGGPYECDIVITSDAQNDLPFTGLYNNVLTLLYRTVEVFMVRIKKFQMMENLYFHAIASNRQITYLSLAWDLETCVEGFIINIGKGNVTPEVVKLHGLKDEWVKDTVKYKQEIMDYIEDCVGYKEILANRLNDEEMAIARKVPINLKALKREQVEYLMRHAENLTELLVKLYCPALVGENR